MFLFIYLFASVMARRCGVSKLRTQFQYQGDVIRGWLVPVGSQITEEENDSSTRPSPPCIYIGGNIIWNTDCCHGWKITFSLEKDGLADPYKYKIYWNTFGLKNCG